MTKVQSKFQLLHAPDDVVLTRLADANSTYGIDRISIAPSRVELTVEYDATRLRFTDVEAVLRKAGVEFSAQE